MKLNYELLKDEQFSSYPLDYKSCFNARGLYHSMQFVLRLRPDLHRLLDATENGIHSSDKYDFETVQAFSTYLHETIHWWQHVGSTSGLLLSLSYPVQAHINHYFLKKYIQHTGLKKPIIRYNELNAKYCKPEDKEFLAINPILNNFHDIEFFKCLLIQPKSASSVVNDKLFESVGHSFHIIYSSFVSVLSSTFDKDLNFLPKGNVWHKGFSELRNRKYPNHSYGEPAHICPIGLIDLYEGQARFSQMQYLYYSSGKSLKWTDFDNLGMLNGVYYSAFEYFLAFTESEKPKDLDSPLIALYLLILDVAINPAEGFPFDIKDYENFIDSTHPGLRFVNLCRAVKEKHPEFKTLIVDFSSSEYYQVSTALSAAINSPSPLEVAEELCRWSKDEKPIVELMREEKTFEFTEENQPIRLLFSQFLKYQKDKLKNPSYFCWTGVYSAGEKVSDESLNLFLKHQSLFSDKEDGDIYPRKFPDKDEAKVQIAFDTFYTWVATYDLSRQWIVGDGEFDYDYFWLSSKHSMTDLESWARHHFILAYGVDPTDFDVIR
ncbi:hypothetical protein [Vreelandella neptunia]|uniref:Uncharacterized protein n=1 Tax=Vreelandella neptunia TaxID=115551 RepID=A0ABZ0YJW7_9GAMM|nr:hypothetical protein [Halomonas neptunia]MDN3562633.1 hypothetical protein [Halomonas neptunia]TDV99416.1 hypothetical protein BDK62_102388 [Halomonas alkaliantarctica]WQH12404.1 hypothetical protein SR894_19980 [Halomonas neptunia]